MDGARRKEIRRWADALERSGEPEQRAAGRALRLLCEENEALARRLASLESETGGGPDGEEPEPGPPRPPAAARIRPVSRRRPRRRRRMPWRRAAIVAVSAALAVGVAAVTAAAMRPAIEAGGSPSSGVVGAAGLERLAFWASVSDGSTVWRLDGVEVKPTRVGERLVFRPKKLRDGLHVLEIKARGQLFGSTTRRLTFRVDTTAPELALDAPAAVGRGEPVTIRGRTEPGSAVRHGGEILTADGAGRFELRLSAFPKGGRVELALTDRGGNVSRWLVPVTVVPRQPVEPVRSVHVTAYGWADDDLREGVLRLIRENKVNAVELDLKDEAGMIGWEAPVRLAKQIGAVENVIDLGAAVRQLHGLGVRVIGRLVCFRDPIHANAAWEAGRRDEVVQTPDGGPYAGYGGFTNFADPAVRKYNVDVAVAAAKLGVDEILYDYVRRPDGPLSSMRFPGLKGTPEQAIVAFLEESRAALAGTKALVGASVFGVAATRPTEVAQDIPAIARTVDYVAPMVYPSHWAPGEYGVADPNASPYEITRRSLADFVRQVRGTGARIVPWLQDFSLGVTYGPVEVAAQIKAARDAGADEFILWDPAVTYTAEALEPTATRPALEVVAKPPAKLPRPKRLPDPKPRAEQEPAGAAGEAAVGPTSKLPPNELGLVPVVMYHEIRPDRVGPFDQTPDEFRADLEYLWKHGYAPVSAGDFAAGKIDLPAGKSPFVLTFDDASTWQLTLGPDGRPKPDTAVGILFEFARTHPGFEPAGTFFVLREPFGGTAESPKLLRWLVANGFELGNHTSDHTPLGTVSDAEVQHQLALGARRITKAVPGYRIRSMSLPLGSVPDRPELAVRGRSGGTSYGPYAVFLVGANPAPSPFSKDFDPRAIPRIRSSHRPWSQAEEYTFAYWLPQLTRGRDRYVSDGDPSRITVREAELTRVAKRFAARATAVG